MWYAYGAEMYHNRELRTAYRSMSMTSLSFAAVRVCRAARLRSFDANSASASALFVILQVISLQAPTVALAQSRLTMGNVVAAMTAARHMQ